MATRKKKALTLTQALSTLLAKQLLPDLAERAQQPSIERVLKQQHAQEKANALTADSFPAWRQRTLEQVGAAWILSCVFVRTLEDRGLLARERLAGEGAADSEQLFFELAPSLTARDYLLTVFREVASLPGAEDLLGPAHNPAWLLSPSNEGARALLDFFRQRDAEGALRWRFEGEDTRFLGDLYQDLSEAVRKRYALLQTPHFVEAFILDHTLEPAIEEYGLEEVRVIDPTCGSGHFLLGAFERLLDHRLRTAPGVEVREHAQAALGQVYGVDVNPYAVAIARFRLTLAYLARCGFTQLGQAPKLELHLVVADSLLHGAKGTELRLTEQQGYEGEEWVDALFMLDDPEAARKVFGQRYHAVVGNPPYITCKDAALRDKYREAYTSAAGKYALAAPFTERFFQLAVDGGCVGMINANSFMKREFGKALIEKVLPQYDLTRVIDSSGVPLPNHGATTTVILIARHRLPTASHVLVAGGRRKDTTSDDQAAEGPAWRSIVERGQEVGFENDYISVAQVPRVTLAKHPWSLGGGGAGELKELLEERAETTLGDVAASIGIASFTLEDAVYLRSRASWLRSGASTDRLRPMVIGEAIRDWSVGDCPTAYFPYDDKLEPISEETESLRILWPFRTLLANNKLFGGLTKVEGGLKWYEYGRLTTDKLRTPLSITFAFVATHNHFVLDRGGKVFKQTAPIIKLPEDATEDDHVALLAYLNSSVACFWMKQACFNKGSEEGLVPERRGNELYMVLDRGRTGGGGGYEFAGTALRPCPVFGASARLLELGREADELGREAERALMPEDLNHSSPDSCQTAYFERRRELIGKLVRLQEEMDWEVYRVLGLVEDEVAFAAATDEVPIFAGERPWEVAMARRNGGDANGVFGQDGHRLVRQLPDEWPPLMRRLWDRRIEALSGAALAELETAKHKRRWVPQDDKDRFRSAAYEVVLRKLEERFEACGTPQIWDRHIASSGAPLVNGSWMEFLEWSDPAELWAWLDGYVVPFLRVQRFTPTGLEKHAAWQHTWALQRREDAGEKVGDIPVPPKYTSKDYRSAHYWRLRGKLDVPKERFISYPGCEKDGDPSPLIGWAGWNHLQRAQALIALYQERKLEDGWEAERLMPMLVGLHELMFWLELWHSEPEAGSQNPAREFKQFLDSELSGHRLTVDDLEAWRPSEKAKRRASKKKAKS